MKLSRAKAEFMVHGSAKCLTPSSEKKGDGAVRPRLSSRQRYGNAKCEASQDLFSPSKLARDARSLQYESTVVLGPLISSSQELIGAPVGVLQLA